tara:strand:+ start:461 stop:1123 length:663 start_codon:yes stop_codon:yes gene_type:complete
MNEDAPINSAGDGSQIALPPAHIIVGKRNRSKYKKNNAVKYDGRTKAGRKLVSRIISGRNKKMAEESKKLAEAATETERAQKQIQQQKKLGRAKDLQKKRDEAKKKMQSKTKEMDTLMKARLSDFKKKASDQQKKLKKEEAGADVMDRVAGVVDKKIALDQQGFVDITVGDKTMKMDNYTAKRVTDVYSQLDPANQIKFRQMLNHSPETYLKTVDFAVQS